MPIEDDKRDLINREIGKFRKTAEADDQKKEKEKDRKKREEEKKEKKAQAASASRRRSRSRDRSKVKQCTHSAGHDGNITTPKFLFFPLQGT